jgi:transcriptional regulator with XRE-family HTH domain
MSDSTFGQWLRQARTSHQPRISQERLSQLTGIERTYLSKMENGKVELPLMETRERIHAALGTTDADVTAFGIDVRRDYETRNQEIERAITFGTKLLESRPDYDDVNPFGRDDPRWNVVESLKTIDVTNEDHVTLLYGIEQVLHLLELPPDVLAVAMKRGRT